MQARSRVGLLLLALVSLAPYVARAHDASVVFSPQLQVPEPTMLALFAIGFLCVIVARWRRHS